MTDYFFVYPKKLYDKLEESLPVILKFINVDVCDAGIENLCLRNWDGGNVIITYEKVPKATQNIVCGKKGTRNVTGTGVRGCKLVS